MVAVATIPVVAIALVESNAVQPTNAPQPIAIANAPARTTMPLPSRKPKEKKKDFLSRCMSDDKVISEFPDSKQRYAVCQTQLSKGETLEVEYKKQN